MAPRSADDLPRREREVLDALLAIGNRASVEQIRQALANPPSYSAVRAMLTRLETKGHVRHDAEVGRYLYSATTSPAAARRAALRRFVRTFFGGSLGDMMVTLVRDERWKNRDLDALSAEIERARKKRNR